MALGTSELDNVLRAASLSTLGSIVNDPISWAETMLIHPETGKAFKANTIQRRILSSKYKRNAIRVHRRAGKTQALAVITLHAMTIKKNALVLAASPMEIHVGEIYSLLLKYIECNEWLSRCLTVSHKDPFTIEFSNGSRFLGLTLAKGSGSQSRGLKVRGQAADVVIIDEADFLGDDHWVALRAIMRGDITRTNDIRVYAATTPDYTRGNFYAFCYDPKYTDPRKNTYWNQIYCSVLDNPDLTPEYVQSCKDDCANELEWTREWLAQWPDIEAGVFPKNLLDAAIQDYTYTDILTNNATFNSVTSIRPPTRTIGVDWDKVNRDGHGPNIAVAECLPDNVVRIIYRVEIPQSEFSLDNGVKKVIELNELFKPEYIFVDRGLGEYQIEELKKYGNDNPETGLYEKVHGVAFNQSVVTPMPDGSVDKKPFKHAMINLLRAWFERGKLKLSVSDRELYDQLNDYRIIKYTTRGPKYNSDNEHGIDAVGLACMAIHLKVSNPYIPDISNSLFHISSEYVDSVLKDRRTVEENLSTLTNIWKNNNSRRIFRSTDDDEYLNDNSRPGIFTRGIYKNSRPVRRQIF